MSGGKAGKQSGPRLGSQIGSGGAPGQAGDIASQVGAVNQRQQLGQFLQSPRSQQPITSQPQPYQQQAPQPQHLPQMQQAPQYQQLPQPQPVQTREQMAPSQTYLPPESQYSPQIQHAADVAQAGVTGVPVQSYWTDTRGLAEPPRINDAVARVAFGLPGAPGGPPQASVTPQQAALNQFYNSNVPLGALQQANDQLQPQVPYTNEISQQVGATVPSQIAQGFAAPAGVNSISGMVGAVPGTAPYQNELQQRANAQTDASLDQNYFGGNLIDTLGPNPTPGYAFNAGESGMFGQFSPEARESLRINAMAPGQSGAQQLEGILRVYGQGLISREQAQMAANIARQQGRVGTERVQRGVAERNAAQNQGNLGLAYADRALGA